MCRFIPVAGEATDIGRMEVTRPGLSKGSGAAIVILGLFLAFYVYGILVWEEFTYYDNSHFTNETLIGRNVPLQISAEQGRFWPLGYQEFDLVRHLTRTITGYHLFRVSEMLAFCAILLFLDQDLSMPERIALLILVLITPSIAISFSGLIYPEANEIPCLAAILWSMRQFEKKPSKKWAILAIILAQCFLYYKEVAFSILFAFAAVRIFLRWWEGGGVLRQLKRSESRLDLCLLVMVLLYQLYYLAILFPKFGMGYQRNSELSFSQVIASDVALDFTVWILIGTWLVRFVLILMRKVSASLFWDALGAAGVCYALGYFILRMVSGYYLAPADLIAILYVGRLVILTFSQQSRMVQTCIALLVLCVMIQDMSLSSFRMYERKNVVRGKAQLAAFIKDRYEKNPVTVSRLYFPYAKPFSILEFASYLNYIGVPVEQETAGQRILLGTQLVGRRVKQDGPCGYREFMCHIGEDADPGDLIVQLPDDDTGGTGIESRQASTALYSYTPYPSLPAWMRPVVNRLHIISPAFPYEPIPDSWLMGSVSLSN